MYTLFEIKSFISIKRTNTEKDDRFLSRRYKKNNIKSQILDYTPKTNGQKRLSKNPAPGLRYWFTNRLRKTVI
jgi:hypothetical protein